MRPSCVARATDANKQITVPANLLADATVLASAAAGFTLRSRSRSVNRSASLVRSALKLPRVISTLATSTVW
jgi:hypothetical protein